MKSFKSYLMESMREYKFRIYFSGKPIADIQDHVKASLGGYKVRSVGDIKSQPPVREHPMFPSESAPEVYTLDVTCEYPATSEQIRVALTQLTLDKARVAVCNQEHADDVARESQAIASNTSDKPLLMQEFTKSNIKAKDWYGDQYNAELVKKSRTGIGQVKVAGAAKPAETTNDLKPGTKSPMGSHKPKLPSPEGLKK